MFGGLSPPVRLLELADVDFGLVAECQVLLVELFERGFRPVHGALDARLLEFDGLDYECFGVVRHFVFPLRRGCRCSLIGVCVMPDKALSREMVVRMPYWSDPNYPGLHCDEEEGLTKQSFKDECDINNIMKRYNATGDISHLNMRMPEYGDFSSPVDFQSALNTVMESEAMFADLPAHLRDRFGNDPKQLLEFLADDANREEAVSLGIVQAPPAPPEPVEVRVVPNPDSSTPQPKAS